MCNRVVRTKLKKSELRKVEKLEEDHGVEVLEVKQTSKGVVPTLINGIEVPRDEWPEVVWINQSCTATLVGPNCAITAAHCGDDGERGTLELHDGTEVRFTMIHMPQWNDASDYDLAVLKLHDEIDGDYATVGLDHVFRVGQKVVLAGFGCTNSGGTGGNDGTLRMGPSKIVNKSGVTDIYSQWREGNGGALCYGDSGGPMFAKKSSAGKRTIIAVNSKGNIRDTNYNMRLDLDVVRTFLKNVADDHDLEMKGVTFDGDSPDGKGSGDDLFGDLETGLRGLVKVAKKLKEKYD